MGTNPLDEARQIVYDMPHRRSGRTRKMLESIEAKPPRTVIVTHSQQMAQYLQRMIREDFPRLLPHVEVTTIETIDRSLRGVHRFKVDHAVVEYCYGTPAYAALMEFARMQEARTPPIPALQDPPELQALIDKARAAYDALSPEEKRAHDEAQRESFVRGNIELDRMEREERMTTRIMPAHLREKAGLGAPEERLLRDIMGPRLKK